MHRLSKLFILSTVGLSIPALSYASDESDLLTMDLTQLQDIEITSVAKKSQKKREVATALSVITQDDIRRSGATSVPEALRLVPGVTVARINTHQWSVSIRGGTDRYGNKLLVLIDGRSVYTPSFSGVYWEEQDLKLDLVDRIEVIRGPGSTVWGANAVHGVINIITKNSHDSKGYHASVLTGTDDHLIVDGHMGDFINEDFDYRIYAKYGNHDNFEPKAFFEPSDDWNMTKGGFRVDGTVNEDHHVTVQGDVYNSEMRFFYHSLAMNTPPFYYRGVNDTNAHGWNLLGKYEWELDDTRNFQAQAYVDVADRDDMTFRQRYDTLDFESTYRQLMMERHDLSFGFGYRAIFSHFRSSGVIQINPRKRADQLLSAFVQDDISFFEDKMHLILGSKIERNDYSGVEIQPSARLSYHNDNHMLWGAASRSVRTPSRVEHDARITLAVIPGFPNIVATIEGNPMYDSEKVCTYELGYRYNKNSFSFDATAFVNSYSELRSIDSNPANVYFENGLLYMASTFKNNVEGHSLGFETEIDWRITEKLKTKLTYTYITQQLNEVLPSDDSLHRIYENDTPHHIASLFANYDLTETIELDLMFQYFDKFMQNRGGFESNQLEKRTTLDARAAWQMNKKLNLSIVGKNLLAKNRIEANSQFLTYQTYIPRSGYVKLAYSFD